MTMSTSSASGSTATVAAEVWMRPLRLGDRHALDAVHAAFEFELGVGALAVHFHHRVLDAAEIAVGARHQLGVPALQRAVARVHAEQIVGEQGRLVAARAGADFDDGGGGVGGILGQELDLQVVLELGEALS